MHTSRCYFNRGKNDPSWYSKSNVEGWITPDQAAAPLGTNSNTARVNKKFLSKKIPVGGSSEIVLLEARSVCNEWSRRLDEGGW